MYAVSNELLVKFQPKVTVVICLNMTEVILLGNCVQSFTQENKPRTRTKHFQFSVSYRGPHLWNSLISRKLLITNSETIQTFKYKVKNLLLNIEDTTQYF